jgi:hypothetical protein
MIALAPLDRHRQRLATDGDLDDLLHIRNLDAVASDALAVDLDLQVGFADNPIREHGSGLDGWHLLEQPFKLQSEALDRLEVGTVDLDTHRRPESGLEHHDACLDRLELRRARHARHVSRFYDRVPDVLRALDLIAPLAKGKTVVVFDQLTILVSLELAVIIHREGEAHAALIGDVLALVLNDGLDHRDRRWIERALDAAP